MVLWSSVMLVFKTDSLPWAEILMSDFFFSIHIWVLECKCEWIKYSGSALAADVWKGRCTERARSITEGLMLLSRWKLINYCRYKTKGYWKVYWLLRSSLNYWNLKAASWRLNSFLLFTVRCVWGIHRTGADKTFCTSCVHINNSTPSSFSCYLSSLHSYNLGYTRHACLPLCLQTRQVMQLIDITETSYKRLRKWPAAVFLLSDSIVAQAGRAVATLSWKKKKQVDGYAFVSTSTFITLSLSFF